MTPKYYPIAPDGLPAPVVGVWVEDKHRILREYLRLQAHPRKQWTNGRYRNGTAYIDLFCGAGMAQVEGTGQYVDGSPMMAWKASVEDDAPFTEILIADADPELRSACAQRLRCAGAPVVELEGPALQAARSMSGRLSLYGLHVVFLDPFSLGALNIELIRGLAEWKHLDILAHVSVMDLFRNYPAEVRGERNEFDAFAPGWRGKVPARVTDDSGRRALMNHWAGLVSAAGLQAAPEVREIRNSANRGLYWLMLMSKHTLAKKFWEIVLAYEKRQPDLF